MDGGASVHGTVLILEDDPGVRLLQRRHLERAGFTVADAADIREARRQLEVCRPDLLLLDYQLAAGENGLEFYRELQREGRDYSAILVTGFTDETRILEAMRAGVRDFLPKTVNFVELTAQTVANVMKQVHQQRQLVAAEAAGRAKDKFLATLSHELRTPLTPVLAIISELRLDQRLPADVLADLQTVHRNINLEARLIDDLLDLTRIVRGKFEIQLRPVNLRRVIEHAFGAVSREGTEARCEFDLEALAHPVIGDSARLTQVFWNLLKNALKFTPLDGVVRVHASVEEDGVQRWAIVEVQDTGIGIEPATLATIFDAFEQGERSITRNFGGLGLGLAISRPIVEAHGGTITASSAGRERGSTFTVRLPLSTEPLSAADDETAAPPANPHDRAGDGASLLLVEDHPDSSRLLARMLRRRGFTVTEAASLAAARLALESETFQLVISDVGLPDGTGFELMSEIRRNYGLPGIALSGFGMEDDVRRAHEAGFSQHLTKPVDVQDLLTVIRHLLGTIPGAAGPPVSATPAPQPAG